MGLGRRPPLFRVLGICTSLIGPVKLERSLPMIWTSTVIAVGFRRVPLRLGICFRLDNKQLYIAVALYFLREEVEKLF